MHAFLDLDIDLESKVIMVSSNDRRKYDAASNLVTCRENVEQIIFVGTDDNNDIEHSMKTFTIYKFLVLLNSLLFTSLYFSKFYLLFLSFSLFFSFTLSIIYISNCNHKFNLHRTINYYYYYYYFRIPFL